MLGALAAISTTTLAQFSPGDLSAAHSRLDGMQNCTSCHEVGNAISGAKCLGCHTEIAGQFAAKHGYHFTSGNTACVTCHKEHLGRNARTYKFDPGSFDHRATGFRLAGKHVTVACAACHRRERITDPQVVAILAAAPRQTYLGLGTACADCHRDPHAGRFAGKPCSSCHAESGWKQIQGFDHRATKFPLTGKHQEAACEKCHTSFNLRDARTKPGLIASSFTDCTPCHATPHASTFGNRACASCHVAEGWNLAAVASFDHTLTAYTLKGKHLQLRCEQCHRAERRAEGFRKTFKIAFGKCTDCHADRHRGVFTKKYKDDCASCHTERSYVPSTFTLARHQETSWPLSGAHQATLCAECHRNKGADGGTEFRFASLTCATCHADVHRGQFTAQMKGGSCETCHSTVAWKTSQFDHASLTGFPLEGKHATVACSDCHKELLEGASRAFRKLSQACESCHRDAHAGQFAVAGATGCDRCHSARGAWNRLVYDHRTSAFVLDGAHATIECGACHRKESIGGTTVVRYKPLPTRCESCHGAKERR